jgi:hypothetical protein
VQGPIHRPTLAKERAKEIANREAEAPKAQSTYLATADSLQRVIDAANRVKTHPGLSRATGTMTYFPSMRGGDAAGAEAEIATLKGQVAVQALTAMREASKTGGAVGNVTEKEWPILESQIAALDNMKQGTKQYKEQLDRVINHSKAAMARLRQAYQQTYGAPPELPPPSESQPINRSNDPLGIR